MQKKFVLYFSIFLIDLVLALLLDDPILAGAIVLGVFTPSYLFISLRRQKSRIRLLEEDCDPQAFIEATDKQYQITGKNKIAHVHLMIDKSAGLASMGRFQEALDLLLSLDIKRVKRSKMRRMVYYNNLMICYDGLDQQEIAKALYDSEFGVFSQNHSQYSLFKAVILFSKLRYEQFEDELQMRQNLIDELKTLKLTKRLALYLKLYESELSFQQGDVLSATAGLKEILENGNKLHIVEIASCRLKNLANNSL